MNIDTHELAWAAGFFDGEGCTSDGPPLKHGVSRVMRLSANQIDTRVLDRFQRAVSVGKVYGPYQPVTPKNAQPRYDFIVTTFEEVQAVVALLWRWLSPVKREQARAVLLRSKPAPPRTVCQKGHPLVPTNVKISARGRHCLVCLRANARKQSAAHRQRKKAAA